MREYVVASRNSRQAKPESLHQVPHIREPNVAERPLRETFEQPAAIHRFDVPLLTGTHTTPRQHTRQPHTQPRNAALGGAERSRCNRVPRTAGCLFPVTEHASRPRAGLPKTNGPFCWRRGRPLQGTRSACYGFFISPKLSGRSFLRSSCWVEVWLRKATSSSAAWR